MSYQLNNNQLDAVRYVKGPLLIIAGAGTGKTTVITEKIVHLINKGILPSQILALTFTEKSAFEMQERVDIALPYGVLDVWISTFHSFCDRILRNDAIHIGLNPAYRIMTYADTVDLFTKHLFEFNLFYFRPRGNPTKFVESLISHFNRLKDEDVSANDYNRWLKSKVPSAGSGQAKIQNSKLKKNKNNEQQQELEQWEELARVYKQFETLKYSESKLEFSDLIAYVLLLFRSRPHIRARYQKQFMHILVDEFQDTNISQYVLLKLLTQKTNNPNISVVGDDSQSIYKFRGAAVSNMLTFMKEYPKAKQIVLTQNYRSTQRILDSSYTLIRNNDPDTLEAQLGISKNLSSNREKGEEPQFIYANSENEEAELIVSEVYSLCSNKDYSYSDIAILVRANNHAQIIMSALKHKGIPYHFLGPGALFMQKEIKDLIAYLKFLYDITDSVSFYRVLSMAQFVVSGRDLALMTVFARRYNLSLFEACELFLPDNSIKLTHKNIQLPFVSGNFSLQIEKIGKMVYRHLDLISSQSAGQILYYFLQDSGILKELSEYTTVKQEQTAQNIALFFEKVKAFETANEDASVGAVVSWITLSENLGESPTASSIDALPQEGVRILTVHSSKGLEFPVVFMVNMVSGRFPTTVRKEVIPIPGEFIKEVLPSGDYHIQEERRLCYVGLTRARDLLYLTASRFYGQGKRMRRLSPFIYELFDKKIIESVIVTPSKSGQLSLLDFYADTTMHTEYKEQKILSFILQYLSYSQLDTFQLCPLKYKYQYLLKIPTPPSAALSFGYSVHEALRSFFEIVRQGENPKEKDLLHFLDLHWVHIGYNSKKQEVNSKNEARTQLIEFLKQSKYIADQIMAVEQRFSVPLTPHFRLLGKFDRVDRIGSSLEVIDYKTGKIPPQKSIDNSLQMTLYALALSNNQINRIKAEDIVLSFYFLGEGKKVTTKRTDKQLQEAKEQLLEYKKEIETSDFKPTPGRHCDFCEFKSICPAWEE